MQHYDQLYQNYQKLVKAKPVVLNLTNSVTQDFMANALLAIGASPIMSQDESELGELLTIVSSLNINIGTLNQEFNHLALIAASLSQQANKPIVLDPVGAGATSSRTKLALQIAPYASIIRGNASEIMALNGDGNNTAGVDTLHATPDALSSGQQLAKRYQNTIVISGQTDLIFAGNQLYENNFGTQLMTKVTGMGCVLSAIIAAFASINNDYGVASYLATTFYTLCAEQTIITATKPASFKIAFIDAMYEPDWSYFKQKLVSRTLQME